MKKTDQEKFEERAEIVKAMANSSRLFILDLLLTGEHNVQQITKEVGTDISTVSRHLSVLKKVGLISCRKSGLKVWYDINTPCINKFFNCVEAVHKLKNDKGCTGECKAKMRKAGA